MSPGSDDNAGNDGPQGMPPSARAGLHQAATFSKLSQYTIDPPSVQLLGYGFCRKKHVVILGKVDMNDHSPVTVGMIDPEDREMARRLQGFLHRPIKPVQLNAYEINKALDIGNGRWKEDEGKASLSLSPGHEPDVGPDRTAQALLDDLLAQAITLDASDVHIERYGDDVDVRMRVDGMLHQVPTPLSRSNIDMVTSRLKVIAQLDPAETREAQDGRITATFGAPGQERPVDFRISIVPGPDGEDVVLRLRDRARRLIDLAALGLPPDQVGPVEAMAKNPEGLVLVTGPVGSGKTTTLYSMLAALNTPSNKVLTVEDPIEYRFETINQKQVSSRMDFADYARAFLRQDPDVIMIGEIRDESTAEVAGRAAQTGHLVLSTLHTGDSVGAVTRLRSLGLESDRVAEVLVGVLAQRLMRTVCPSCRAVAPDDAFAAAAFARLGRRFDHVRGAGCEHCHGTGYSGRVGIFEVLRIEQVLADQIAAEASALEIRTAARRAGMRTLYDEALALVERGQSTFEEVRRCVPLRLCEEPPLA